MNQCINGHDTDIEGRDAYRRCRRCFRECVQRCKERKTVELAAKGQRYTRPLTERSIDRYLPTAIREFNDDYDLFWLDWIVDEAIQDVPNGIELGKPRSKPPVAEEVEMNKHLGYKGELKRLNEIDKSEILNQQLQGLTTYNKKGRQSYKKPLKEREERR